MSSTVSKQGRITTRQLTMTALFVALIAVGAFIRVPLPNCPFTLQILFTTLAGIVLGSRLGATSVGIYIVLGLIGVPIFTSGGGPGYILQPTFGYLIGFMVGRYYYMLLNSSRSRHLPLCRCSISWQTNC